MSNKAKKKQKLTPVQLLLLPKNDPVVSPIPPVYECNFFTLHVTKLDEFDNLSNEQLVFVRIFSEMGMTRYISVFGEPSMNLRRWKELINELTSNKKPLAFVDMANMYLHHVYCAIGKVYKNIFPPCNLGQMFFRCKTIKMENKAPRSYIKMMPDSKDIHLDDIDIELLPTEDSMKKLDGHILEVCLDIIMKEMQDALDVSIRIGDMVCRDPSESANDED